MSTVPTAGLRVQVTAVFPVPVTVAVNCCVVFAVSVTGPGPIETVMPCVVLVKFAVQVDSRTAP